MAGVDYYGIQEQIKAVLDAALTGVDVTIERETEFGGEAEKWVTIYLDSRSAPGGNQTISGGTRTEFEISYSIWCTGTSLDTKEASKRRDELIGDVEVALMGNSTLNDSVKMSWLDGGEFVSGKDIENSGFNAAGEVRLICVARATT